MNIYLYWTQSEVYGTEIHAGVMKARSIEEVEQIIIDELWGRETKTDIYSIKVQEISKINFEDRSKNMYNIGSFYK